MRLHILGVCGTFMGGLAHLARDLGHEVSGSDAGAYPPMSDQLAAAGIEVHEGYGVAPLEPAPDCVVVGNALTRGNPAVEYLLDSDQTMCSGPDWLARNVLRGRHVLAVAGTHGKTTTSAMLAWILECAGRAPGFLIGGVPGNFGVSARLGAWRGDRPGPFVVEADEYDSAFFDKRSKFVHYRPRTLAITNIEYDHADIFPDVEAILRQFHHLVRIMPATGSIIRGLPDRNIDAALAMGCWTPVSGFGIDRGEWQLSLEAPDASRFRVSRGGTGLAEVRWDLYGLHNALDALAAIAAAAQVGVDMASACAALDGFVPVKRRLEARGCVGGISVHDDFAHHPTAVRAAIAALRARVGDTARILAVLDPASNTMRIGVHRDTLGPALAGADRAWIHRTPRLRWDVDELARAAPERIRIVDDVTALVGAVANEARRGDHVLILSNAGFGGFPRRLLDTLRNRTDEEITPETANA